MAKVEERIFLCTEEEIKDLKEIETKMANINYHYQAMYAIKMSILTN